jgi:ribosomal protein S18 acetylase RimI-like enzyme
MVSTLIEILDYRAAHQPWFEKFNRDWIEKYFSMEPLDYLILGNPHEQIVKEGGSIFMATWGGELAGTVALKLHARGVFELTKMAVDERFQGKKIGRALADAAITRAKDNGAEKIFLYSNTLLVAAVNLYMKLGFLEVPLDGPYQRTNIKMELLLLKSADATAIK